MCPRSKLASLPRVSSSSSSSSNSHWPLEHRGAQPPMGVELPRTTGGCQPDTGSPAPALRSSSRGLSGWYLPQAGHQPDTAVSERSRGSGLDTGWAVRAQYGGQPGSAAPGGTMGRRGHHGRAHPLVRVDRPYALNPPPARFSAGRTRERDDHPRTASPISSGLHGGASEGQPPLVHVRRVMSRLTIGKSTAVLVGSSGCVEV